MTPPDIGVVGKKGGWVSFLVEWGHTQNNGGGDKWQREKGHPFGPTVCKVCRNSGHTRSQMAVGRTSGSRSSTAGVVFPRKRSALEPGFLTLGIGEMQRITAAPAQPHRSGSCDRIGDPSLIQCGIIASTTLMLVPKPSAPTNPNSPPSDDTFV